MTQLSFYSLKTAYNLPYLPSQQQPITLSQQENYPFIVSQQQPNYLVLVSQQQQNYHVIVSKQQ